MSESFYEIEPEEALTEEEVKVLEALEKLNASKAETNEAFNETQESKHFAQAYKPIAPPEDYIPKTSGFTEGPNTASKNYEATEDSKLKEEELSKFSKVNDLLKKQQEDSNNSKSTISFSLKDRTKISIPPPVYLCEKGGKIVINITVNAKGNVTDAYVNTASNSSNECLREHALEYAKKSTFSPHPNRASQIGSITFYFIGKR
ncbi:TonB family protein [Snuella sp. CAU 1569]|uniref:TonB family protein n=1 Tax=Snuella sedimenti TaxID=2798802 RepID=A0A8J7JE77_9FLAO|nr:TonB family protein [Snuella sedimenti]